MVFITKVAITKVVITKGGGLGARGRPVAAQQVGKELAPSIHQAAKQGLTQAPLGPAGIADHP